MSEFSHIRLLFLIQNKRKQENTMSRLCGMLKWNITKWKYQYSDVNYSGRVECVWYKMKVESKFQALSLTYRKEINKMKIIWYNMSCSCRNTEWLFCHILSNYFHFIFFLSYRIQSYRIPLYHILSYQITDQIFRLFGGTGLRILIYTDSDFIPLLSARNFSLSIIKYYGN